MVKSVGDVAVSIETIKSSWAEQTFGVAKKAWSRFDPVEYVEKLRNEWDIRFRLPDCIHLATAKLRKAQVFITNDSRLKRFEGVRIFMLKEVL